jgi:hypothetical protein
MKTFLLLLTLSVFTWGGVHAQPTGNYITMNGGNDNVYIPHASYWNLSGDFTISMKVKFTYTNVWQMLMTHSPGGFELSFTGSQLWLSPTGIGFLLQASWNPSPNIWYHLVITRIGSTISAYVDGQLIGTGSGGIGNAASPLRLGNYYVGGYSFYGSMDEVSIWNIGATQSDINSILSGPLAGNEAGLVSYWKLDETGAGAGIVVGNTAQLTGNTLDGVTQGSSTTPYFSEVPPPPTYCLDFDGTNDVVNLGNSLNSVFAGTDNKFTIEALIRINASDNQFIFAKWDPAASQRQFGFRLEGNKLTFIFSNSLSSATNYRRVRGSTVLNLNEWYHVAVTYDGTISTNNGFDRVKFYVNGQIDPIGFTSASGPLTPIPVGTAGLSVGAGIDPNNRYTMDGIIKNVRAWSKVLSQAELQTFMYSEIPNPLSEPDLKLNLLMNEGSGQTMTDYSISGLIGYLGMNTSVEIYDPVWTICTPPVVQEEVPYCLDFDGIDDYVNVGNKTGFDMNFTMTTEAWIFPEGPGSGGSAGSGGSIVNKEGEFEIARFENGYIGWAFANYSPGWVWVQTTAYTPLNQWSHVAVVYDTDQVRTYLNGILQHSYPVSGILGDVAPTYNDLWISGRQTVPGGQIFDGKMDEVRIWSIARTEAQIREEMHREIPSPATALGLVANYSFNSAEGNIAYDHSINLYHGTLTNMDQSGDWEASTAPVPFATAANGGWESNATWKTGQNAPVNAWARVKVDHTVSLNSMKEAIDVTIAPTGILTLNQAQALTVTGSLTNEKGVTGLILKSGTTGTATLIENDGVAASVERYFSGNDIDWHLVSSPVSNALTGVFVGKYLQWFDESSYQYFEIIPSSVGLIPLQGYAVYGTSASNKVTFTGNLNTGNLSIPVTNSATSPYGWNLVGNPYSSSLDWNLVIPTLTNIGSTIYYLEAATGNWLTWNGTIGSGSQFIPPMQGFFISATNNSSLNMTNAVRSHFGSGTFYKDEIPYLTVIKATGNGLEDKTYIQFSETATPDFDADMDGYKIISVMNPALPQVFTTAMGKNLSINVLPQTEVVPLSFHAGVSGTFTIGVEKATDCPVLILEDTKTGTLTDLKQSEYDFNYTISDIQERFNLHFTPLEINENIREQITVYTSNNNIYVKDLSNSGGTITICDMKGNVILKSRSLQDGLNTILVDVSAGLYLVKITTGTNVITEKIFIR